ncbi:hypothetical protein MKW98_018796 [Papaver atlanticum]|uniref:Zeta toxin domain-containing protein n=1 Tax=Papaver atlanticum TaxID=357466 RepID=A0AAD4XRD4_9MAGN|nr:hypothetical protein MKW98_018796 [Papaver atlanticum]
MQKGKSSFAESSSVGIVANHSETIVPILFNPTTSVCCDKLERFSVYVARQIGFSDPSDCPQLCKLAYDYLRSTKGCEVNIYGYIGDQPDADALYVKFVEEFERCILGYFAFHWHRATAMVTQILKADSDLPYRRLKCVILATTRKQRFESVVKYLKVKRIFCTLMEEIKAIGITKDEENDCKNAVMVPVPHGHRSPVLLLMGGGMGAGKSTVLLRICKESFWSGAAEKAVIVEADAFKESDVIYQALRSKGHPEDMLQTAELVHQSSLDAAASVLVTALNRGRDVILDGTLSWEPFVKQTIAMARNVHRCKYRMGVGYKIAADGTVTENYWEQDEELANEQKPYRIELVGVVSDAYLAVARGIRRAILVGRAVRVNSQLRSHKGFANAFPNYCNLVDNARLFCTNGTRTEPKLIGWKEGKTNKLLVDQDEIGCLQKISMLNDEADSIYEMYQSDQSFQPGSEWYDLAISSSRAEIQQELKIVIGYAEKQLNRKRKR